VAAFSIPAVTLANQHSASKPDQSVWVSANAGAGKTHVLASRVIRLLLQGVAPSKILCLTFTKAAAANMAARVLDTLATWTQLSDDKLSDEIAVIGAQQTAPTELLLAKRLFARAVETPGGLRFQTIHAFCEHLLHMFPFEANVPSRFEVADECVQSELLQRALRDTLTDANSDTGAFGEALRRISDECGQEAFEDLIKDAIHHDAIAKGYLLQDPAEVLRRFLGLAKNRDVHAIEREIAEGGISPARWNAIADVLDLGTSNDKKWADRFRQAFSGYQKLSFGGSFDVFLDSYRSIFFTGEGKPRNSVLTKGLASSHPEIAEEVLAEQLRLERLCADRLSAATLERTGALVTIATAVSNRYAAEKALRGILDFDDLIGKTLTLLERSDARWVLYKLDSGIDHILIDEAQDTSEAQWKILEKLTSEFSSGEGRGPASRTFFAVGDAKQSIFSFQGAAPKMFDEMRRKFESRFRAAAKPFARVPLADSFRSVPGILATVDKVFAYPGLKNGLTDDRWMAHQSLKRELPGIVEIWPLVDAAATDAPRDWRLRLDLLDAQDPANIMALRVAQKIQMLISREFVHDFEPQRRRPVRPGDILILVRSRGALFEAMICALKQLKIPAAGADRLVLTNHIAVMDLIAAGRAVLTPEDDLRLACVLKSPLIGLDDNDLLRLAPRRSVSLFEALNASVESKHIAAAATFARWRARAGGGAFAFYARLLGAEGGRRDMEARLGLEACDAIDEFLRLAIAHEDTNTPSLCSFLNGLEGLKYEVKRDMENAADMVRVMTVHAAKGLEAKIVFLPDSCSTPSARHDPKIFLLATGVPGEEAIAWSPKKDLDCAAVAGARAAMRTAASEEYRRLLYVALTRAEERLYIAGFSNAKPPDSGCWFKMIEAALGSDAGFLDVPAFWDSAQTIRRFVSEGSSAATIAALPKDEDPAVSPPLPVWLFRAEPIAKNATQPLTPSRALAAPDGAGHPREFLQRGRAMHLLLQYLPAIPPEKRQSAALAFLSARASFIGVGVRKYLAAEALALFALPELAPLFGPGSKAEVFIAGQVRIGESIREVAGQVDRICESANEILVADYKTGAPCTLDQTPKHWLTQMALYRAVLAQLWKDKDLRMALICTAGPNVIWLPDAVLDAALAALAA
jgi:ATP-dependent helicase/nuclease subunit A